MSGLVVLSAMTVSDIDFRGWDQTGSNGANLSFPDEFGIPEYDEFPEDHPRAGDVNEDAEYNSWIVGLVNAGPYIAAALLFVTIAVLLPQT